MKKDLQDKLYEKYPEVFANRALPASQSLMCFGLDIDDGWYAIIDVLCWTLVAETRYLEQTTLPLYERWMAENDQANWTPFQREVCTSENLDKLRAQLVAMRDQIPRFDQVKEKFGGLRIYYSGGSEAQKTAISMAMALSYKTCETCGATGPDAGVRRWQFGWVRTQCRACAVERNGEEAVIALEQGRDPDEEE